METGGSVGCVVVVVAAGLLGWLYLRRSRQLVSSSKSKLPLPPGSMGWPFVGETLDLIGNGLLNKWTDFYATRAAKYGEVFSTNLFLNPTVMMPAPEGNKYLFANESKTVCGGVRAYPKSVSRILGHGSLAMLTGEKHKQARRVYMSFFNPESLRSFIPKMSKIAGDHFRKEWDGRDEICLAEMTKEYAFTVACYLFLSMEEGDINMEAMKNAFKQLNAAFFAFPINIPGTAFHKGLMARNLISQMLGDIISQRRKELQEVVANNNRDLLDVLLSTTDDEGQYLTDDSIIDNLVTFLWAGYDTTAHTLLVTLRYLYVNKHCLEGVTRENLKIAENLKDGEITWEGIRQMKYSWQTIQETMRVEPAVLGGFREAVEEFEFGGYTIPKGWKVMYLPASSNKSAKFFPNPETFDPTRFEGQGPLPYTYLPFGGGPKTCVGSEFARIEMLIFLHHVVLHYQFDMVDPNEKIIRTGSQFPGMEKGCMLKVRPKQVQVDGA